MESTPPKWLSVAGRFAAGCFASAAACTQTNASAPMRAHPTRNQQKFDLILRMMS
jgi:hypothetical protein